MAENKIENKHKIETGKTWHVPVGWCKKRNQLLNYAE